MMICHRSPASRHVSLLKPHVKLGYFNFQSCYLFSEEAVQLVEVDLLVCKPVNPQFDVFKLSLDGTIKAYEHVGVVHRVRV